MNRDVEEMSNPFLNVKEYGILYYFKTKQRHSKSVRYYRQNMKFFAFINMNYSLFYIWH